MIKKFNEYGKGNLEKLTQEQIDFLDANTSSRFKGSQNLWSVDPDGRVSINGDFSMYGKGMKNFLGIDFHRVTGNFNCSENLLTNLEGCPEYVGGSFECSYNEITSLEGAPSYVGKDFDCMSNKLTSLEGCPEEIEGTFSCEENQITSLNGGPYIVLEDYICSDNKLTNLEGAPSEVGGDFSASKNSITTLEGFNTLITGYLNLTQNKIEEIPFGNRRLIFSSIKMEKNPFWDKTIKPVIEKDPDANDPVIISNFIKKIFYDKDITFNDFFLLKKYDKLKTKIDKYFF